jgi:hypothetical protein
MAKLSATKQWMIDHPNDDPCPRALLHFAPSTRLLWLRSGPGKRSRSRGTHPKIPGGLKVLNKFLAV